MNYTVIWDYTQAFSTKQSFLEVKDAQLLPNINDLVTLVVGDDEHISVKVEKIEHEVKATASKERDDLYLAADSGVIKIFGTRVTDPKE